MISSFWNIPGIQSNQSFAFLEQLLNPICVYDDQGHTLYASQSFLELLQTTAEDAGFFDWFPSDSIPLATLTQFWERALSGEPVQFLSQLRDASTGIKCSLQFNSDAAVMFLTARKADAACNMPQLLKDYKRTIRLFEPLSLATALVSADGSIIECNQRLHELFGTRDRETLCLEQFVHPEDQRIDQELKQKLLNGDLRSYTIEKRFVSRTNGVVWVNLSVSLLEGGSDLNQHPPYFAVLLEDVSESRKLYSALVRTEEKWKAFALNSAHLFIQTSSAGQIIYASPAVEQILGYKEDELLGRHITDLIHPNQLNEFELALQLWISNLKTSKRGLECWWRMKSGRWVCLYIQGQPFPSALEINGVVITGHAITDRKCLEIELKSSHERLKSLVCLIPGAVFQCDSTYTMTFVSDAIEDITGYSAAAFIHNQARSYLSIIHPDDIAVIKNSLVEAVLDRHRCSVDYRIIHADGRVRWVTERKQGMFDQNGNLLWLDGVLLDISERVRVEDERKQAETTLRQHELVEREAQIFL